MWSTLWRHRLRTSILVRMDELLRQIAAGQGGVFSRAQALECGYSTNLVRRLLRTREWTRVRRGIYGETQLLESLAPSADHLVRAHAVVLAMANRAVVSHTSAVLFHGLPDWGLDLSLVHVTRAGMGGGRIEAGVHHHRCIPCPEDVVVRDGVHISTAARAVVETATISPVEAGVVMADAALHHDLVSWSDLCAAADSMPSWQGSRRAGRVIDLVRVGAESPGETRLRLLMRRERLPEPELQVPIHDDRGHPVGRVDFLFRAQRTIVEFDGMMKYGLGGGDPATALAREKEREDRLRELGYEVVRITWADLAHPGAVAARIRAAFARTAARRATYRRPRSA